MSNRYRRLDAGLERCDCAMTLSEIAQELGVTRERVRQIEIQALAKAKKILERWGYSLEDLVPERERRNYSRMAARLDIEQFLQDRVPEADHHTEGSHPEEMQP